MSAVGVLAAVVLGVSGVLLAAKIVRWRVWLLPRRALVVLALVAALATLQAQKGGGPMRSAPVPGGDATSAPVMITTAAGYAVIESRNFSAFFLPHASSENTIEQ